MGNRDETKKDPLVKGVKRRGCPFIKLIESSYNWRLTGRVPSACPLNFNRLLLALGFKPS